MTIKRIDELERLTLSEAISDIEDLIVPLKKDGSADQANGIEVAQLIVVDYESDVSYVAGRRIQFESVTYGMGIWKVLTTTTEGQTPDTNPEKFELVANVTIATPAPYILYVGSLSQVSTSAPVSQELQDTIGLSAGNFTRSAQGTYLITKTNAFTVGKTIVFIGGAPEGFSITAFPSSVSQITIQTSDGVGSADGVLSLTSIEIRVYP